jgi:hypothetical protein
MVTARAVAIIGSVAKGADHIARRSDSETLPVPSVIRLARDVYPRRVIQ